MSLWKSFATAVIASAILAGEAEAAPPSPPSQRLEVEPVAQGEMTSVLAAGSSTRRTLADRFSETKNVLDYGASPTARDNSAALHAAVEAAAADGGGTVLIPSGIFRYTQGIALRDNVSITGYGEQSVLFYDPPKGSDVCKNFAVMFQGSYSDYPNARPICDEHPTRLIAIAPAAVGDVTITASTAEGFSRISVGDWIIVAEGTAPKWNFKIQYCRVIGKDGRRLTLERPLDFSFDGTGGKGFAFGVERIRPVQNAWLTNVTVRSGSSAVFGGFGCGLAVGGGVRGVVFDPFMDPASRVAPNPFANDVHQFEISRSIFRRGNFGGFNRSSYSRFVENFLPAVNDSDQEYGEGASFNVIAYNHFAGHTGKNPLIGIGQSFFIDVSHNVFSNVASNSAVKVVAGVHGTIAYNTFNNVKAYAISIGTADATENGTVTADWLVIGNRVLLQSGLPNGPASPSIAVHAFPNVQDVIVSANWVDHPIKIGTGSGTDDQRTIWVYGNAGPGVQGGEPTRIAAGSGALAFTSRGDRSVPSASVGAGRTWNAGDVTVDISPEARMARAYAMTSGGTTGPELTGVTGSVARGSAVLMVNDASKLRLGTYLQIEGVQGPRQVAGVAGKEITLNRAANASVSSAPIHWSAPSWEVVAGRNADAKPACVDDVASLRRQLDALTAKLRAAGVVTE
jgi:hypothetical protein